MTALLVSALLVLGGAAPASADEERWRPAAPAHLGGSFGLTGFGTMIDGRIPSPLLTPPDPSDPLGAWSQRLSLRYDLMLRRRLLRSPSGTTLLRERSESLTASYGLSVLGLDLALGVPYRLEEQRLGPAGSSRRERVDGAGPITLGAKVALRIPKFFFGDWAVAAFGPYVLARVPSGPERVDEGGGFGELGLALAGPYGYSFRWIGNFALRVLEGGRLAGIYRFGCSAVPLADDERALRLYLHVDGIEYEGAPNSDLDVAGGLQVLWGRVTFDLGLSYRVVDSGYLPDRLRRDLRASAGEVRRGWHDDEAFALTLAVGVIL